MMSRLASCTVAVGGHDSIVVLEQEVVPVMSCANTLSFTGSVTVAVNATESMDVRMVGVRNGGKSHVYLDLDEASRNRLRMAALDACVPPENVAGMGVAPNQKVIDDTDELWCRLVGVIPADRLTSQGRASIMMHRWLGAWYKIKHQMSASGELNK